MKPLTREEMISVIEGKGNAGRVPLLYHFWTNPVVFGENENKAREYLASCPMDIQNVWVGMPDMWVAPADAPSYRWMHHDQLVNNDDKGFDARVCLDSYDDIDDFLSDFPSADYPALWKQCPAPDGRYRLLTWWYWLFERQWSLRGMDNALTDFYLFPEETHRLFDKLTSFYCDIIYRAKKNFGIDGVFTSDDIGTQHGPFFSPEIFREFFKPYYKRVIDCAHENGVHMWMHSCGNIEPFLPELIEIGLDVIHPIQKYTMDEREIAGKYGDKICICAGFDVQRTIPYGKPKDVVKELHYLVDTYTRKDGRFMLTMGNGITSDCPIESLRVLLDESVSYGTEIFRKLG